MSKKIWRCFSCGGSGNVLDFAVHMEGGNPDNPADVRRVAILLVERFLQAESQPKTAKARAQPTPTTKPLAHPASPAPTATKPTDTSGLSEVVNPPLDFALKNLDPEHVYLRKREFDAKTIKHFGLGYCSKGMFAGRIAIPLHNATGGLIGYAGQLTDEFDVSPESPGVLWPSERERNGVKHMFDRELFVYHGHSIKKPASELVVVQDFHAVWRVFQSGIENVVGIMGDMPSTEQTTIIADLLLLEPHARIWIMTDDSPSAQRCAGKLLYELSQQRSCRWVKTAGAPDEIEPARIRELLEME